MSPERTRRRIGDLADDVLKRKQTAATLNFRRQVERQRVSAQNDGSSETSRDVDALVVLCLGAERSGAGDIAKRDHGSPGSGTARGSYSQQPGKSFVRHRV